MERNKRLTTLLGVCILTSLFCLAMTSAVFADEEYQRTKLDPRDVYLGLEAICGTEAFPYEYMIPKEEFVKTKLNPDDIYVDLEAFCSEDMPVKYLVVPGKYIKTKIDYEEDRKIGLEEMISEDPTSLEIKSK
jgi:methyl coenzyme M reductase subunit D